MRGHSVVAVVDLRDPDRQHLFELGIYRTGSEDGVHVGGSGQSYLGTKCHRAEHIGNVATSLLEALKESLSFRSGFVGIERTNSRHRPSLEWATALFADRRYPPL